MIAQPTVHILLATYNGERYLYEQLKSIENQTYPFWALTVSDDGSTDKTLEILESFTKQVAQTVSVIQGPKICSSTANFFNLINRTPTEGSESLYAFCDQDDVWHKDKIEKAVTWHTKYNKEPVRLYCARTEIVDKQLRRIGFSSCVKFQPNFGNAIVENIASGNTMIFNEKLLFALRKIRPEHSIWHDWTTYLVATGIGGIVFFDNEPCLLYRQHELNLIGKNNNLLSIMYCIIPNLMGRFKKRLNTHQLALMDLHSDLSPSSMTTFKTFIEMRDSHSKIIKLKLFANSPIRRQKLSANLGLILAIFLNFI
jgi:glycosyltransferase involved in cell wall biosynthesis